MNILHHVEMEHWMHENNVMMETLSTETDVKVTVLLLMSRDVEMEQSIQEKSVESLDYLVQVMKVVMRVLVCINHLVEME